MTTGTIPNRLLKTLPSVFQDNRFFGDFQEDNFLEKFLWAFERILLGGEPDTDVVFPFDGLEETINDIALIFDPCQTPEKFLTWLSEWTSFTLRSDFDIDIQREFIANIIQLYRHRGTKKNLQKLLKIFTIGEPLIVETNESGFQIGVHSTIDVDTYLGGGVPHFFKVIIALQRNTPEIQERQMEIAYGLIELEKPAHTYFTLASHYPSMQVGKYSTIGVDTLLGTGE